MADDGNLSATLSSGGDNGPAPAPAPQPPEPTSNMPVGDTLTPPSGGGGNLAATLQPAVNPKLNRTFLSTLKGIALGFMEGNIPGAIQGGIDPSVPQRVLQQRRDTAQANVTFANARAAHEVAMAHQADVEYQALPEKLQQEGEKRGLENMSLARQAGYLPIATVPLDQGTEQNSQGASTALNSVKQQFGAVPSGLLYIHTGSGMTVMKLQDPAAALTTINQSRRAQGMPEIQQDAFMQLAPGDRDSMARDAINFADPRDINGMVTQNSINIAKMRLETVKAQPEFNGKDALVKSLQQTVDHQKAVLDSGAQAEATRAGQAQGTQAQAAQPGQTAAEVAKIQATAGPEAKEAGEKAGAIAKAQFPFQVALEKAKQGSNPVYAFDPKQNATVLTTKSEAQERGLQGVRNVTQPEIEKDTQMARQLGDAQMNVSSYRVASRQLGDLSTTDKSRIASMMSDPHLRVGMFGTEIPTNWVSTLSDTAYWKQLSPTAQDAMVGYIGARGSIIAYAKAISGSGKLTESQLQTELKNLPDPTQPPEVREKLFERFQRNIDQASSGIPKIPGVELPGDIRAKVEANIAPVPVKPQGKYKSGTPVKEGQNIQVAHIPGLSRVTKVYSDGTFDTEQ